MSVVVPVALPAIAAMLLAAPSASDESPGLLEGHKEYVYMISSCPDSQLVVTASGDNTAIIWDTKKRTPLHVLSHDAAVYAATLSPDGQLVATASGDGNIALWNARDGRQFKRVRHNQDAVYCVAFSPDGRLLASAGGSTDGGNSVCRVWCVDHLKPVAEFSGHRRQVYGVAFSPDGRCLATSSSDKTIRLWNVASGTSTVLQGHTSDVYRCEFSPDGERLASASQDGTVRVWSVKTGGASVIHEGSKKDPVYAATFSTDGRRLAAVGDDRRLRVWRTTDLHLESEQRVSRNALYAAAFLPRLDRVAVAGEDGKVYLIEASRR